MNPALFINDQPNLSIARNPNDNNSKEILERTYIIPLGIGICHDH